MSFQARTADILNPFLNHKFVLPPGRSFASTCLAHALMSVASENWPASLPA